jgi:FO synthase subunit 1
MGLMLETTARLPAHELSPGKEPKIRLRMIEDAGKLHIPFTTGILVGIGETRENRIDSLETIAEIQLKYGHIQEVIIQNFMPKPGTRMESIKPPPKEEMLDTVQLARRILPADVEVQVAPNLIDPYLLIKAGAKDLGGISPTTIDWINPEAEWPDVEKLKTMARDVPLKERLPIYPQYIRRGWYSKQLDGLINSLADSKGYRK